jgi:4-azaleucine resistance transporter AzlC
LSHSNPASQPPLRLVEFVGGVQTQLPLLVGVVPFGLIYGMLGLAAGLPAWAVILMSSVLFAGASQLVFVQLWGVQTPPGVVFGTVTVVNLRHLLYSASLSEWLRDLPLRWRMLLAYLLTDEAFAGSLNRFRNGPASAYRHWFLFGAGLTLWTGWQLATILGVWLGSAIPNGWSLDFSIPIVFIALLVMAIQQRSEWVAAGTAGWVAVIAQPLPHMLWILLAAVSGILAGLAVSRLRLDGAAVGGQS